MVSAVSNNGRLDILCESSATKILKIGQKGWCTLQRKDDTAEELSLWRSFDTNSAICKKKRSKEHPKEKIIELGIFPSLISYTAFLPKHFHLLHTSKYSAPQ